MASARVRHHLVSRPTGRADPPLRNPIGDIRYARRGPGFRCGSQQCQMSSRGTGKLFHAQPRGWVVLRCQPCGAVGMLEEGDMKVGGVWDLSGRVA